LTLIRRMMVMKGFRLAATSSSVALLVLGTLTFAPLGSAAWARLPSDPAPHYRAGEIIVSFRDGVDSATAQALKKRIGLSSRSMLPGGHAELLQLPGVLDVRGALASLRDDPAVAYAEPNYLRRPHLAIPSDPLFSSQWGLYNTGQANFVSGGPAGYVGGDLHLPEAWDSNSDGIPDRTGTGAVTAAIIDGGFLTSHPDLTANFIAGYDFQNNDADPSPSNSSDDHGTEVAGCLGAIGNNAVGVASPIWNVKMMPLKFGYDVTSEVNAMEYARTHGAQLVNLSFGGPTYSQTELNELLQLQTSGLLIFASAGNENSNTDFAGASYPANYLLSSLVAVAATNRQDDIASFSTYGPVTVPVAAPGLQIVTTTLNNGYTTSGVNGTSFSSPYAAGVAALIKDYAPAASALELKSRLIEGADAGVDPTTPVNLQTAGGRINANTSLGLSARPSLIIVPQQIGSFSSADSGTQTTVPIFAPVTVSGNGNTDQVLDPGETATLTIKLQNLWQSAASVTGALSADNGVMVNTASASFGTLASQGTATGAFSITVPSSLTGHQYLHFTLNLSANAGAYTATRHFTLEVGRLASGVSANQTIGTGLYDNYQTWHFDLTTPLPSGQDTLSFQTAANSDIDIIVSYQTPPQYDIDLAAYTASNPLYYTNVPDAQIGGSAGGNEYVNIKNPALGTYYVTVVNYAKTTNTPYTIQASTNQGGVGCAASSSADCGSSSGGGGSIDPLLIGGLLAMFGLRRTFALRRKGH